ncbi:MAG: hypothetical protein JWN93_3750 [Hyphomicrobiales bacterium]|nr:hypothetical protein [Hyphomicrobiales bacterium]
MHQLALHLLTLFAALYILGLCKSVAPRVGLLDYPDVRKHHAGAVPLVGGIGVFLSSLLAIAATPQLWVSIHWLLLASAAIVALGAYDDRYDMKALTKLLFQIAIATILVLGATPSLLRLQELPLLPPWAVDAVAIFFLVGLMNAINMLDGSDGLAASVASVALAALVVAASLAGASATQGGASIFLTSVVAFLLLNAQTPWRRQASVFLGDAGSMLLGLVVGYFVLDLTNAQHRPWAFSHAIFFVAFPLVETASLAMRRTVHGGSPFRADRDHMHHLLLEAGFSPAATAMIVSGASLALAGTAGLLHVADFDLISCLVVGALVVAAHALAVRYLTSRRRKVARDLRFRVEPVAEAAAVVRPSTSEADGWR